MVIAPGGSDRPGADGGHAAAADLLALEVLHAGGVAAEDARGLVLAEDDLVAVDVDLERIFLFDVESPAEFNRYHDTPQFVDFPHDAGGLHEASLLSGLGRSPDENGTNDASFSQPY